MHCFDFFFCVCDILKSFCNIIVIVKLQFLDNRLEEIAEKKWVVLATSKVKGHYFHIAY